MLTLVGARIYVNYAVNKINVFELDDVFCAPVPTETAVYFNSLTYGAVARSCEPGTKTHDYSQYYDTGLFTIIFTINITT